MTLQQALYSPALSTASSFDYLSSLSSSVTFSEVEPGSEDEIVWAVSREGSRRQLSESELTDGSGFFSDEDIVLVGRRRSDDTPSRSEKVRIHPVAPQDDTEKLADEVERLKLKDSSSDTEARKQDSRRKAAAKRRRNKRKAARDSQVTPVIESTTPSASTKDKSKKRGKVAKGGSASGTSSSSPLGLGARSLVDDNSERLSVVEVEQENVPSKYEEARRFISSYLSNPQVKENANYRLTLLQSLIIELGLATSSLPTTLTSAKAYLKSKAFLNIREYLAVRGQGPDAMQKLLHPSKSALARAIRKNGNRASLKWVKEHGLQVLLVSCSH